VSVSAIGRKHALQIFRAALDAADPEAAVLRNLKFDGRVLIAGRKRYRLGDRGDFDRIRVIGAGKASARMARAVERLLGKRIAGGLVNVQDGLDTGSIAGKRGAPHRIELNPSGHPVPDERGLAGAERIAAIARESGPHDLLICLISGGASALLPLPAPPVTLADSQDATRKLLAGGATIHELNTVRKHTSRIKGGQLAQVAYPAAMLTLILSDVIGDDLDVIGSGPTVGDRSTCADAQKILDRYGLSLPLIETPKPGDEALSRVQNVVIGSNRMAIDAAARHARTLGYRSLVLSTFIQGETRDIAEMHAAIVREIQSSGRPAFGAAKLQSKHRPPVCVLSGGETTVTVRGKGLGGRNQEFVLAAAIALDGSGPVTIFSAGTDGIDGPTDVAGAIADESTLARARALGLEARAFLENNDSYHFFRPLEALVKTGPTGTNVMDVRLFLIR
jgi:glycerate 2-kinase